MSRIYWDSMLLIYFLENHPVFERRVRSLLSRAHRRGDSLFTSYLALGEIMAGIEKSGRKDAAAAVRIALEEMGFCFLPFNENAVAPFSKLRAHTRLKAPDAIHLACAAAAGMDLYLTGDAQLFKLDVPGIQFIANFNSHIL
jgi:predicted nucleic acid-binding protein